jgi:hypothetical protein
MQETLLLMHTIAMSELRIQSEQMLDKHRAGISKLERNLAMLTVERDGLRSEAELVFRYSQSLAELLQRLEIGHYPSQQSSGVRCAGARFPVADCCFLCIHG